MTNLSNEGDEDVEGTETIHIHGDADVEQIFSDLARIAQRVPGGSVDQAQLDQVESAIDEASLDVYSGKDDQILRKLSVSLVIEPTGITDASTVSSVDIDFSFTLSDVNEPQTISEPSDAQPISGLLGDLGLEGLGGFGSSGGSGGSVGGGGPAPGATWNASRMPTRSAEVEKCADELL